MIMILLNTIKLLYYMTIFEKFGMFLKMLLKSIHDMFQFLSIFAVFIF